jgi:hypothetical protein
LASFQSSASGSGEAELSESPIPKRSLGTRFTIVKTILVPWQMVNYAVK